MTDLREELRAAMEMKGYTYARLLEESGLTCDLSSLNRKINGGQALDANEGRVLARVLGVKAATVDKLVVLAESLGVTVAWLPLKRRGAAS